jgi:hypothetical protein
MSAPWIAALCLIAFCADAVEQRSLGVKNRCDSFRGRVPPELVAETQHWIGASEAITLAKLKGRVVWLEFNF